MNKIVSTVNLVNNIYFTKKDPVSLIHFLTNRCNARCSFCFIDFDNPNTFKNELTLEEIDKLTKSMSGNLKNVNLTGGEPFARADIEEIARMWLKNTNINSIFLTTNGSLPKRINKFVTNLSKEFPKKNIFFSISIDGLGEFHDDIRKIKGLFNKTIESYNLLRNYNNNVFANIAITVSHENYQNTSYLYEKLKEEFNIKSFSATIVRDEGVYKIPIEKKEKILKAYNELCSKISHDLKINEIDGYPKNLLQGRLMNEKNLIVNEKISEYYLDPKFISPCHAGSLFGIIEADGTVKPCEILSDVIGNLRDYGMNFSKLWSSYQARILKRKIIKTKCHCSYECAWSFNVLGNYRYQPRLLKAALLKR